MGACRDGSARVFRLPVETELRRLGPNTDTQSTGVMTPRHAGEGSLTRSGNAWLCCSNTTSSDPFSLSITLTVSDLSRTRWHVESVSATATAVLAAVGTLTSILSAARTVFAVIENWLVNRKGKTAGCGASRWWSKRARPKEFRHTELPFLDAGSVALSAALLAGEAECGGNSP